MSYYFSDNFDDQNKQKVIPKTKFRKFLQQVLLDFTCFSTPIGHYKQVFGLGMGSPISGLIANLYLSFIEELVIQPKIENKELLFYGRYADDTAIASNCSKTLDQVFQELNNYHENLKWTSESMQENKLNFLDTTIYWDNNTSKFELQHFQKSTKSDCFFNFNRHVVPKDTKIGVLMGKIYRCQSTTTTETQ